MGGGREDVSARTFPEGESWASRGRRQGYGVFCVRLRPAPRRQLFDVWGWNSILHGTQTSVAGDRHQLSVLLQTFKLDLLPEHKQATERHWETDFMSLKPKPERASMRFIPI
mmetsp:Transcript_11071/g.21202  ORF Transcript_11071/g.21202 Transcript_11071/m.21202 type:complete len:112 (+) Transcript_11071:328-663(+)